MYHHWVQHTPFWIRIWKFEFLLLGFIQDLNGMGEEDTVEYTWKFGSSSSSLDPPQDVGYEVFSDIPEDEPLTAEEDIMFDMSDEAPLPTYRLSVIPKTG